MHYTSAAVSTLYVKVRVRKSPYANKTISIRVAAHFYQDFKPSNALHMRELNTGCTMQQLQLVVAQLQQQTNAAHVQMDIPNALLKSLSQRG